MKYSKKRQQFEASNLTYNPLTKKSYSYRWYLLTDRIGQYIVLNNYSYSPTTARHVSKVRGQIEKTFTKIDVNIECPKGLQDLDSGIQLYNDRITNLIAKVNSKGTKKEKNNERLALIAFFQEKIELIEQLKQLRKVA